MAPEPGAPMPMQVLANLRDIGGWDTAGGPVREGLLYRSTALSRASEADLVSLAQLGLDTIFDLRTAAERSAAPNGVVAGTTTVKANVLGDADDSIAAGIGNLLTDPVGVTQMLADGRGTAFMIQAYEQFATQASAHDAFSAVLSALASDSTGPALVHCTMGKDRTGWLVAALLLLLGVSEEDVVAEYLLTNASLVPALGPLRAAFDAGGGDSLALEPVLGVRPEYLQRTLDLVTENYGSIQGYAQSALRLDDHLLGQLRERFLVVDGSSKIGADHAGK